MAAEDLPRINMIGNNCPLLKDLHNHVVSQVAHKWRDLGVQLLRSDQHGELDAIESNYPRDVMECCKRVLKIWLDTTTDATWSQLIIALRSPSIGLNTLATQIENLESLGETTTSSKNTTTSSKNSKREACDKLTTIEDIEVEFAIITNKIKQALIDNNVDVNSLIEQLCTISAVSNKNVPLFDKDVFTKIRTVDEFWKELRIFWNIYDYDILRFVIKITKCEQAQKILEEFLSRIDPSAIEDVDLVLHCRVDQKEGLMRPILRIKVNAENAQASHIQQKVKKIVSQKYNLEEYALCFKGIKKGCIELQYHISEALKSYLLQHETNGNLLTEFSANNIIGLYIDDVDIIDIKRFFQGSQPNYGKLEESLRKQNQDDLESGINLASEAIDEHNNDAKLYLLRARLSYKLLLIRNQQEINEHIRNCLGDCEQAIAIIERGFEKGDVTTVKRDALQLGYLCCVMLKDVQKEKEFEHRMSEMNMKYPITDQTINQLLLISSDQQITGKFKKKHEFVKLVSSADDSDHEGTTEEENENRQQTSTGSGCTEAIDTTVSPNSVPEVEPPNNTTIEDPVLGIESPKCMTPVPLSESLSMPVSATGTPAVLPFGDKKDYKGLRSRQKEFHTEITADYNTRSRDINTRSTKASPPQIKDKPPVFHDTDQSYRIIKAAGEEKGGNLDALLRIDQSKLNSNCYDNALKVAIEKGRYANAEKLILAGATNIDEVMESAIQVDVKLMLLMVKAVLEDDYQLIMEVKNVSNKLFNGSKAQSEEILSYSKDTRNPKYSVLYSEEMIEHITSGKLMTSASIKLAIKLSNPSRMLDELLSITNINIGTGSVGWDNLNLKNLDGNWITNLTQHMVIKYLNLSQNQLKILPIGIASHLRKCTKLDLHNNNMESIPASILELPLIKELNLSHNKISEFPEVSWSASLIQLNLSYNQLETLPSRATEQCANSMQMLQLGHNQLKKVPNCVCFLCALTTLDISYNPQILVLPVELGRLKKLDQLILNGLHRLYDPPPSICENPSVCIAYLNNKFHKTNKYYRMKLMLVGKESVGKTTIVACLQGRQHSGESTVGVDIGMWSYRPGFLKPSFYFSVWDFAGQEEYYATHQVFLSKRSLYLAVWNVMDGKEGIVKLKPWLNNIVLRAPESKIIIVATHFDELIREHGKQQAIALCDEYGRYFYNNIQRDIIDYNVSKVKFVGLKGRGINVTELKKEIYKAAEDFVIDGHSIMGSDIPASYNKTDNYLFNLSKNILHAVEFKKVVRNLHQPDLQSDDEIKALTLFLHNIGSLLHFDDHRHNLDDLYFVKPQWLCKLMSNVITVKERNEFVKDGRIAKSAIRQLFKQAGNYYSEEFLEQYLALFNRFELAIPLDKQGYQLLIPCFLPSEKPTIVDVLHSEYHYQRQFEFCNAITPPGLWSRLLSRLMISVAEVKNLMDQNDNENGELHYWDKGLYCHLGDSLFVIESRPSQGEGIYIIYSLKAAQKGLLSQLVNLVQQIVSEWFPGLKFEQKFYCYECIKREQKESFFKLKELLDCITENKPLNCSKCRKDLDLTALAPDLILDDIDPKCILDIRDVHLDNIIWSGKFGKVYCGEVYCGDVHSTTPVLVKFYDTNEGDAQSRSFEVQFQIFRAEVAYLQRIKHPCLVGMIGVCKYPNIALVLEDGPMGSLDSCLLKELLEVPRVVVYRIATQIASAVRFLRTVPFIYHGLTTSKVFIWSLSMDDLVNCKLASFEIAIYGDMGYIKSSFADDIVALQVSEQAVYDETVDIFILGMVYLQLMRRSYPIESRQAIPELEISKMTKPLAISIPDSELYHIGSLARKCCSTNPADRPDLQQIVEQLCDPVFQLVMDVATFDGKDIFACTGCVRHVQTLTTISHSDCTNETWICCRYVEGSEITAFSLKSLKLESEKKHFIKDHQIYTMLSHGNNVWATSMQAGHKGSLLRFDSNKKDEYVEVPIQTEGDDSLPDDYGVSLACSDDHVYVGTASGWCLMFSTHINNDTLPILGKKLSSHYICSMIVIKKTSLLWVSTRDQLLFVDLNKLEFDQDMKGRNTDWQVKKLLLSSDEEIVWTVHTNGHHISAWNAQKRECICLFNTQKLLDKRIDQPRSRIVSAIVVLGMLWVGLISGHILVVTATLPRRALIIMKPYKQMVEVLVPIYGKDNNNPLMISIGEDYQLEKQSSVEKQKSLDVVLWEVVNAKHMLRMSYLSTGNAWLNDASLNEVTEQYRQTLDKINSV